MLTKWCLHWTSTVRAAIYKLQSILFALWRQKSYLEIGLLKNLLSIKGLRLFQLMKWMHYTNSNHADRLQPIWHRDSGSFVSLLLLWLFYKTCFQTSIKWFVKTNYRWQYACVFHTQLTLFFHFDASIASNTKKKYSNLKSIKKQWPAAQTKKIIPICSSIETNWPFRMFHKIRIHKSQ